MIELHENQKRKLDHALVIVNPKNETIFGILGRMEVLLDLFKNHKEYTHLVPFLETYYLVTKTVADRTVDLKRHFKDWEAMEKLDIQFASLYFHPLKIYLESGRCLKPWQAYFKYFEEPKGIPFLQMLLGINSHINGDLAWTLSLIKYREREDFLAINDILDEEIPKIMSFLAFHVHDPLAFGGVVFKNFIEKEFKRIIVKWRSKAWRDAQLLSEKLVDEHIIVNRAEAIAHELINIFANVYSLQAATNLNRLNSL